MCSCVGQPSQMAQWSKNPPANAGDKCVQSMGQEDPLEEERSTAHFPILAWRTEEPEELVKSMESQRVGSD